MPMAPFHVSVGALTVLIWLALLSVRLRVWSQAAGAGQPPAVERDRAGGLAWLLSRDTRTVPPCKRVPPV